MSNRYDPNDLADTNAEIDAHEVYASAGSLWVGSVPPRGYRLAALGYTHVVLCAEHFQYPAGDFVRVDVVHCPYEDQDGPMRGSTMAMVFTAARAVAEAVKGGGKVLVTCAAGINRSALVAALAMQMLGVEAWASVERIRAARFTHCLSNEAFKRIALGVNRESGFYIRRTDASATAGVPMK